MHHLIILCDVIHTRGVQEESKTRDLLRDFVNVNMKNLQLTQKRLPSLFSYTSTDVSASRITVDLDIRDFHL